MERGDEVVSFRFLVTVMAGLVPAIYAFFS
jgi:hypothetical protein